MPRSARVAPGGVVFHVLNRANAGLDLFEHGGDFAAFEAVLAEALEAFPGVELFAYCLMHNHWHLVVRPRRDGELGRFVQRLTVTHVRRRHEHRGTTGRGHLYQGTYKSFPVQADEHLLALCRYVERNAMRAGLVRRAAEWRWCSLWVRERGPGAERGAGGDGAARSAGGRRGAKSARHGRGKKAKRGTGGGDGPRVGDGDGDGDEAADPALPRLSEWPVDRRADWAAWVDAPQTAAEEQALAECIRRGRPYGSPAWQKRTASRLGLQSTFRPRGRPPKAKAPAPRRAARQ